MILVESDIYKIDDVVSIQEQERIKRNQEAKARERRYIFWCNPNESINKNKLGSSRIIRNKKYDYYY